MPRAVYSEHVFLQSPQSLYRTVPWLPRRIAQPLVAGLFFVLNVGLIIAMAVVNMFHVDYYTYWNFLLVTVWLLGIAALFPIGGWLSALWTQWFTPMVLGSVTLVPLLIWIVVAIDDRVYIAGTAADPDTLSPDYTFSQIRTGDWIVHGLPLLEVLVVFLFDFQIYLRGIVYHWERSANWWRRWWYWAWVYVAPLLPMGLYMAIFDPRKKYTDAISLAAGVGIAVGLDVLVQTIFLLSVRIREEHSVELPNFYAAWAQPPAVLKER